MKFSIIVPVYNTEKYIKTCLESITQQSFKDFEVIIVNDGSNDNSQLIIDEFVDENPNSFKSFVKENTGVSDTRNFAIKKALGDYLIFVDSDDYIDNNFLEEINKKIKENEKVQLLRVQYKVVTKQKEVVAINDIDEFSLDGQTALIKMRNQKIVLDVNSSYCVKRDFWNANNFEYCKGKEHEDFRIWIVALLKADLIVSVQNTYYNYVVCEDSITRTKLYDKILKKANDKLEHYDFIIEQIEKMQCLKIEAKQTALEYITTALCMGIVPLKQEERKKYRKELKKRKVLKNIKCNSLKNIIRKIIFAIMINT